MAFNSNPYLCPSVSICVHLTDKHGFTQIMADYLATRLICSLDVPKFRINPSFISVAAR